MTAIRGPDSPTASDYLSDAERALLKAAATGKVVDLRAGDADLDNPANAADWASDRNIRAGFLADLLTGDRPTSTGRLRSVKLRGARITGTLDLEARRLLCPVMLRGCYFDEAVNLNEAKVTSARLPGCHVPKLNAAQLRTTGNVHLSNGFVARGEIRLTGAHIGGQLNFRGASLTNANGPALNAHNLTVDQSMFCDEGFTASGEVALLSARIGGILSFVGAKFTNDGPALVADGLIVDQSMFCSGFTARGETRLFGAHIGGQLNFTGASLTNESGRALNAEYLAVNQSMFCSGFTARGEIRLPGAHIGGQLNFTGASLTNESGPVLHAEGLTVDQSMFCDDGFNAQGETRLVGAHIGRVLSFRGGSFANDNGPALAADRLIVDQSMFCDHGFNAHGGVSLRNAKVGMFNDDRGSWPDELSIRGFTYEGFGNQSLGTRARLQWLRRHDEAFTPQIYDQLADVYQRAGDDNAARKVLIAKQWRRRKPYNPLSWLWWVTVGYGYRTWQAFIWAAVLTVVGALVFSGAYPAHMIASSAYPPRFQPVMYALDVLLPIGGLGQKSAWQATGSYLDWYWGLAIAGWVLSAAVVAGLTGILKRD